MYYVAYGSNLHPARIAERIAGVRFAGCAELAGWALRWHKRGQDGSGKCDIVETVHESVHVAVYRLERHQLTRLDAIEGVGAGYEHREIVVPGFGSAVTYRAAATHVDESLQPFGWYKALVIIGCEHHGFGSGYVERIRRIAHIDDPDRDRHADQTALASRIRHLSRADLQNLAGD